VPPGLDCVAGFSYGRPNRSVVDPLPEHRDLFGPERSDAERHSHCPIGRNDALEQGTPTRFAGYDDSAGLPAFGHSGR
jgi:hypothetical protein